MRYMRDGSPIPSHVPSRRRGGSRSHYNQFRLMKGSIVDIVFPEDNRSKSRDHIEYIVNINGRDVPGCSDIRNRGAIYDYSEKTRRTPKKSLENKIDSSALRENLDAEFVYVLFLNGDGDYPIIIGADEHPNHPKYKKASGADGNFDRDEFNGVEIKIDKDSSYTIKQLGRKDQNGDILNPNAVGTEVKISGVDGSIIVSAQGDISLGVKDSGFVKVQDGKVAMGTTSVELLQQISDQLNEMITWTSVGATHTHVGNLAAPTSPPITAPAYIKLGASLSVIKASIDSIKGNI